MCVCVCVCFNEIRQYREEDGSENLIGILTVLV